MVNATPLPLYLRKRPGTHCIGGWVGPQTGLDGCGNSCPPTGIRSPDRPARSESLYQLSCPGPRVGIHCVYELVSIHLFAFIDAFIKYCVCRRMFIQPMSASSETECIADKPGKSGQFCYRGNKYDNSPTATQVSTVHTCTATCCSGSPLWNVRRFGGQFSLFRGRTKSEH